MITSLDKLNIYYKTKLNTPVDPRYGFTQDGKMIKTPPTILIVDDQPNNIRTLSALLTGEGYKVRKALNGETALEAAHALPPDLILLDIMMPQMSGYEVCSALKASIDTREIPIIFLSALSDISDKTEAFAAGGLDYITKPFQVEEVLLRVSHQLTIYSQRQELVEQNDRLQQEIAQHQKSEAVIQRQAQQERLLSELIRHIRQSLKLDEILTISVEEIRHLLQVDQALIFQFDSDWRGKVVAESVNTTGFSLLEQTFDSLPWMQSWQELFDQGQHDIDAHVYSNLQINYAELLGIPQIRASLSFPIWHSNKLWGIAVAHHYFTPHTWADWEVDFLRQCTAQLAIAIQHSELYHHLETQVQKRTADLQQALEFETLLKHIADTVRDSLDEHQILQAAVEELSQGLALDCCEAYLYSADLSTSTLTYKSQWCNSGAIGEALPATGELHHQLLQKQLFQFCWCQPDSSQRYVGAAVLACPTFDDQQVLGSLWLFRSGESGFTDLEIRLIKQVANQCAIALRQSRLYQAAQTQVKDLQKLNQLKDDFLHTMSHELRTPIANINMVVRLLMIATGETSQAIEESFDKNISVNKIPEYLEILQEECERELSLMQDLLNFQQLETGAKLLDPNPLNLDFWLPHITEPFESRCARQEQTLQIDLAPDLPMLTTDSFCLSRIVIELLNNACKYTSAQETITIAAYAEADMLSISVTNSGVEIPAEQLDLIFDKFYRIAENDPWKYGGTGLGLALVKKLVEHLQGKIEVKSENRLTCFVVTLPLLLEIADNSNELSQ